MRGGPQARREGNYEVVRVATFVLIRKKNKTKDKQTKKTMLFPLGDTVPGNTPRKAECKYDFAPPPCTAGYPCAGSGLHDYMYHSCCCIVITMTLSSVMYVYVSVVVSMCMFDI